MVGNLVDGRIYEKYRHELVAPDKVISKLTMLRANDGKLVPVKKYSIEYKIIPGSYEAVVVKKVEEKLWIGEWKIFLSGRSGEHAWIKGQILALATVVFMEEAPGASGHNTATFAKRVLCLRAFLIPFRNDYLNVMISYIVENFGNVKFNDFVLFVQELNQSILLWARVEYE